MCYTLIFVQNKNLFSQWAVIWDMNMHFNPLPILFFQGGGQTTPTPAAIHKYRPPSLYKVEACTRIFVGIYMFKAYKYRYIAPSPPPPRKFVAIHILNIPSLTLSFRFLFAFFVTFILILYLSYTYLILILYLYLKLNLSLSPSLSTYDGRIFGNVNLVMTIW